MKVRLEVEISEGWQATGLKFHKFLFIWNFYKKLGEE